VAWAAAVTAIPTVIDDVYKIISSIDQLSKTTFTPKGQLKDQNSRLSDAVGKFTDSIKKIGLSIRDYEDIYTVAVRAEATAKALKETCSVWKDAKQGANDPSIPNGLEALKLLDLDLSNLLDANKQEIENEDFNNINRIRSDIRDLFYSAQRRLDNNTPDSWTDACDDIDGIFNKIGSITSVLSARFKAMSSVLISLKPTLPSLEH